MQLSARTRREPFDVSLVTTYQQSFVIVVQCKLATGHLIISKSFQIKRMAQVKRPRSPKAKHTSSPNGLKKTQRNGFILCETCPLRKGSSNGDKTNTQTSHYIYICGGSYHWLRTSRTRKTRDTLLDDKFEVSLYLVFSYII